MLVAIALLLAGASYRYVELPFWKGRFSDTAPLATVTVAVAIDVVARYLERAARLVALGAGPDFPNAPATRAASE